MDRKALLNELKIDRGDTTNSRRPIKWFVMLALGGGLAFVAWAFGTRLLDQPETRVETVVARAAAQVAAGDSVLDATGYVVARRQATVSSKATGKVREVLIEEGMAVREGQLLATLDDSIPRAQLELADSQLAAARAALAEIRVNIRQAELDLERTRNLADRNLASQAELDRDRLTLQSLEARLARAERDVEVAERGLAVRRRELEDMQIRAPFSGVVIAKAAQPGEMISPVSAGGGFTRTGIGTIVDMNSLEVEVDVNEAYINRVYPKQPATVKLNAYPDFDIAAEVIATIPAADRNKATVRVRIALLQRDARILPDMGVKVAFLDHRQPVESATAKAAVLVPRVAVGGAGDDRYVWVVKDAVATGPATAERRPVAVGRTQGSRIQIIEGLENGEHIVATLRDSVLSESGDAIRVTIMP